MEEDGKIHLIFWEARQLECKILMERDVRNGERFTLCGILMEGFKFLVLYGYSIK